MSVTPISTVKNPLPARRQLLLRFYKYLLKHFGPSHWWPADHSWEMMAGAILTQNTAWTNVEQALRNLKSAKVLSIKKMATMKQGQLEQLIRPAGFFHQKAQRLQAFARYLLAHPEFHRQLLGHPGRQNLGELRSDLLAIKGIGPETADSMLLYAGQHPTFVVDAYTRRIGHRWGLFFFDDYHQVQDYFQQALPKKAAMYNEFHALLVKLAKTFCKKRNPLCAACPVRTDCQYVRGEKPK